MNEGPDHETLIAQGRLHPAKDPSALRDAQPLDRGISAEKIDAAIDETREDRD